MEIINLNLQTNHEWASPLQLPAIPINSEIALSVSSQVAWAFVSSSFPSLQRGIIKFRGRDPGIVRPTVQPKIRTHQRHGFGGIMRVTLEIR